MNVKEFIREIINKKQIHMVFQPIVSFEKQQTIGYEALARGPKNTVFETPKKLFKYAKKAGMLNELELLCIEKALKNAVYMLPADEYLFINVGANVLETAANKVINLVSEYIVKFDLKVVIEITEHTAMNSMNAIKNVVLDLKQIGVKFAIDDVSSGKDRLTILCEIEPNFVKIGRESVASCDTQLRRKILVEFIYRLSTALHAEVIAEGIETKAEYDTIASLGVTYGQGFYFGKPSPVITLPKGCLKKVEGRL